jgi:hypothetical protein
LNLWFRVLCLTAVLILLVGSEALPQPRPDGYVSVTVDRLPNAPASATELRARLFAEETLKPFERLTIHLAGFVEGLVADRDRAGLVRDAIVRPQEAYIEVAADRADLRVGYSRVVWGRLDEIQPTDVVNPLDLARYFFEGRGEARLPVALVRGRAFFGERATVDALLVPKFRRGTFDQLDEDSSPFNLEADQVVCLGIGVCPPLDVDVREPALALGNLQGGARLSATTGRVDWAISAWRGFDTFGVYDVLPPDPLALTPTLRAVRSFPRQTMIGGDFETARGSWAFRGEAASFFTDDQADRLDAGAGFDRRAGEYHVSGTVLVHHESARDDAREGSGVVTPPDAGLDAPPTERTAAYTSLSFVSSAERTFGRERYRSRAFVVYNATERTVFARNITSMEVVENVVLEGSIGWFFGSGRDPVARDVVTRFGDRDFLYARLRVHF